MPPNIEHAMQQHLQQNLPQHLKRYVGDNRPAYVPQHIEQQLGQAMQKNMPAHLKQYSGAYLQQRVVRPGMNPGAAPGGSFLGQRPGQTTPPVNTMAPPDPLRLGHSMPIGEQHTVQLNMPEQYQPTAAPTSTPSQTPPDNAYHPTYDFIMNPDQPAPPKVQLPGGGSLLSRILVISGVLVVLLVGFNVLKGVISDGGFDPKPFINVAQDQQALIHLTAAVAGQQNLQLSPATQNFIVTAQLSLTSSRSAMANYLTTNGQKIDLKLLSLRISTAADEELAAAASAGTYERTLQTVMKEKITKYTQDLQQTYKQAKGEKGKALLSKDYDQAELLLLQLAQASGEQ